MVLLLFVGLHRGLKKYELKLKIEGSFADVIGVARGKSKEEKKEEPKE